LWIDQESFTILAVGEVANENLANLGHLVVKFNGQTSAELPGDVNVPPVKQLPPIQPGTIVQIK
jgi:glucitol/sorbitol PTS system EIIA component